MSSKKMEADGYIRCLASGASFDTVPASLRKDPEFLRSVATTVGLHPLPYKAITLDLCLAAINVGKDALWIPENIRKAHYADLLEACIAKGVEPPSLFEGIDLELAKKALKAKPDMWLMGLKPKTQKVLTAYAFDECGAPWSTIKYDHWLHTEERVRKALARGTPPKDLPTDLLPMEELERMLDTADEWFVKSARDRLTRPMWERLVARTVVPLAIMPLPFLNDETICRAIGANLGTPADVPRRFQTERVIAAHAAFMAAQEENIKKEAKYLANEHPERIPEIEGRLKRLSVRITFDKQRRAVV